jgi:ADP-ribose pyrophosphatase
MVGETGFEPATFCSQSRHSTRLSYSPSIEYIYFCLINSQTVKKMQVVKKIKKISLSKSFFPFWRYQFLIKSFNKKIKPYKINREILSVGDVVFALCYSPEEKKFYLIKQFRPFSYVRKQKYKFELVGGLVDKGETINQALKREIMEEIGVKTLKLKKLTKYCPVPGYSDEIVNVYYAEVEKIKKSHLYNKFENEEIKVSKFSLSQLKKINSSEQVQNVLTKVSIYEYLRKIKKSLRY